MATTESVDSALSDPRWALGHRLMAMGVLPPQPDLGHQGREDLLLDAGRLQAQDGNTSAEMVAASGQIDPGGRQAGVQDGQAGLQVIRSPLRVSRWVRTAAATTAPSARDL